MQLLSPENHPQPKILDFLLDKANRFRRRESGFRTISEYSSPTDEIELNWPMVSHRTLLADRYILCIDIALAKIIIKKLIIGMEENVLLTKKSCTY